MSIKEKLKALKKENDDVSSFNTGCIHDTVFETLLAKMGVSTEMIKDLLREPPDRRDELLTYFEEKINRR